SVAWGRRSGWARHRMGHVWRVGSEQRHPEAFRIYTRSRNRENAEVAGGGDDKGGPKKEDTLPETTASKGRMQRPAVPDGWKPPPRRKDVVPGTELVPSEDLESGAGARVDFAFGEARVRTFEVKGPFAVLLALVVLGVVAVVVTLMFVFA